MKTKKELEQFLKLLQEEMNKYGHYEEGIGWMVYPGVTKKELSQMECLRSQIVTLKWVLDKEGER